MNKNILVFIFSILLSLVCIGQSIASDKFFTNAFDGKTKGKDFTGAWINLEKPHSPNGPAGSVSFEISTSYSFPNYIQFAFSDKKTIGYFDPKLADRQSARSSNFFRLRIGKVKISSLRRIMQSMSVPDKKIIAGICNAMSNSDFVSRMVRNMAESASRKPALDSRFAKFWQNPVRIKRITKLGRSCVAALRQILSSSTQYPVEWECRYQNVNSPAILKRQIQPALKKINLYSGKADGILGRGTKDAIHAFELKLENGTYKANGCLTFPEIEELVFKAELDRSYVSCNNIPHASLLTEIIKPRLHRLGFYHGPLDDSYSLETRKAIVNFEKTTAKKMTNCDLDIDETSELADRFFRYKPKSNGSLGSNINSGNDLLNVIKPALVRLGGKLAINRFFNDETKVAIEEFERSLGQQNYDVKQDAYLNPAEIALLLQKTEKAKSNRNQDAKMALLNTEPKIIVSTKPKSPKKPEIKTDNLFASTNDAAASKPEIGLTLPPPDKPKIRVALVIGNSNYQNTTSLKNPVNDANLMASTLEGVGFKVTKILDADLNTLKRAMLNFGRSLRHSPEAGLFYYAGHGVQVRGENYLVPVNANISDEDEIELEAININSFLRVMNSSKSSINIVVLDACRNNPFARSFRSISRGLAPVDAPKGTYIAYATSPGDVASDGEGHNSPYSEALANAIKISGLAIEEVFKRARKKVLDITGSKQVPWETSSITGNFYFQQNKPLLRTTKGAGQGIPKDNSASFMIELALWNEVKASTDAGHLQIYLDRYPDGIFAGIARIKLRETK